MPRPVPRSAIGTLTIMSTAVFVPRSVAVVNRLATTSSRASVDTRSADPRKLDNSLVLEGTPVTHSEVSESEDAGWDQLHPSDRLTHAGRSGEAWLLPGSWPVTDLLGHIGSWLAAAGWLLERTWAGTLAWRMSHESRLVSPVPVSCAFVYTPLHRVTPVARDGSISLV